MRCAKTWKICINKWTNIFPNDQWIMLHYHEWIKHPFRVQARSVDVSVKSLLTGFPFPHYLSSFGIVSRNNIHNCLKNLLKFSSLFQLHMCVRLDCLCIWQQHNIWLQKLIWVSGALPLIQTLKSIWKNVNNTFLISILENIFIK